MAEDTNTPGNRLLLVEDDTRLAQRLTKGLQEAGYTVESSASAAEARRCLNACPPALVIMDLGLPDADGFDLLRELRALHADLPVIVTTARDKISDRVQGLELGADDYLVKPFAFDELLARIRTQLRHSERVQLRRSIGGLALDLQSHSVTAQGEPMSLTPKEFDLLAFLMLSAGQTLSRDAIGRDVWHVKSRMTSIDNVIDVHVSRLRKKLEQTRCTARVEVIRGVGIRLKERE